MSDDLHLYRVRRATPGDATELARCRAAMFRVIDIAAPAAHTGHFETYCEDTIAHYLSTGSVVAWLAEASSTGETIGSATMLIFPRLPTPRNPGTVEGYLGTVFVHERWRRRGIATAVTTAAVAYAHEADLARVRLHAEPAARAIYERAGFVARDNEMEVDLIASNAV